MHWGPVTAAAKKVAAARVTTASVQGKVSSGGLVCFRSEHLNNLHLTDGVTGWETRFGGLNGGKGAVVAGQGRGKATAPPTLTIYPPLPPTPGSAAEGEGRRVPCGKLCVRVRGVCTRVCAPACASGSLYTLVCVPGYVHVTP